MSQKDERRVSELLRREFKLNFIDNKFRMDDWGEADNYAELSEDLFLVLEVDTRQKHPNTNVLKVWPYLEEKPDRNMILMQAFFPDSPGLRSNRGKLAEWTATKMQNALEKRFSYCRIIVSKEFKPIEGFEEFSRLLSAGGNTA